MNTTIYRKEISDYVDELLKSEEKIKLDSAVEFNSFELEYQRVILQIYQIKAAQKELKAPPEDKIAGIEETAKLYKELSKNKKNLKFDGAVDFNSFVLKDQQAILWIYQTKAAQQELKAPIEDKIAGIEETARLYRAQKCAFQDVLTEKNFDPTQEVPKTYGGRIAILTNHGTFIMLGKSKRRGRLITMERIHSPGLNYDKYRGYLKRDLKLNSSPHIDMVTGEGYQGSPARALAVNPHGSDDDELEEKNIHDTVIMMGLQTAHFLTQPRKLVKSTRSDE